MNNIDSVGISSKLAASAPKEVVEAHNHVTKLQSISLSVTENKSNAAEVERILASLTPLSREASEVIWSAAGAEGAHLRGQLEEAIERIAGQAPGAIVHRYGPEAKQAISDQTLAPVVTAECTYLQVAMLNRQLAGNAQGALEFARKLVERFPNTAAGYEAKSMLDERTKTRAQELSTTGFDRK